MFKVIIDVGGLISTIFTIVFYLLLVLFFPLFSFSDIFGFNWTSYNFIFSPVLAYELYSFI